MIRSEVSAKNKYYISKYRYYELKYHCLQYPIWKKAYDSLSSLSNRPSDLERFNDYIRSNDIGDPTAKRAIALAEFSTKIDRIKKCCYEADNELSDYILKGVTNGYTYDWLYTNMNIPCSRGTYYDRYRKFFWILNKERN